MHIINAFIIFSVALLQNRQVVVISVSNASTSYTSPVPHAEWYALLDLKAKSDTSDLLLPAWNGSNLHNICKSWTGVTCTPSGRHIAAINLAVFGLAGSLSPHLGNLSFLSTLNLSGNQFSGGIPTELSACSSLRVLDLNHNHLTGHIPPSLGSISSLQVLRLCNNSLGGPIPLSLFTNCTSLLKLSLCQNALTGPISTSSNWHLPRLRSLLLWENHLTGPIPRSLGNCSSLEELYLDSNALTGEIPSEVGSLGSISGLSLHSNNLTGTIPRSLGNFSNQLEILELFSNQLSGTIPEELGLLSRLQYLELWNNRLTGSIPPTLANCTELVYLELSSNQVSGSIPNGIITNMEHLQKLLLDDNQLMGFDGPLSTRAMSNTTSLIKLDLGQNLFGGPIPTDQFGQHILQGLQFLRLDSNQFLGTIPWDSLCNCTSLIYLGLSYNHLTGSLSSQLGRLSNLQYLYLQHNSLQGSIPDLEIPITSLLEIDFSFNQLNGTLPDSLANALIKNSIYHLDFSHNGFSGMLPTWLGKLSMLQQMDLSHNDFVGTIPESLGDCMVLTLLNLSDNNLVGEIPPQLGGMLSLLTEIDLSHNHLTGPLPSTLQQLQHLHFINVSFNNLEGPIPVSGVFRHLDASSFQGNPGLCGRLIHKPCAIMVVHGTLAGWKSNILITLASLVVAVALIACFLYMYQYFSKSRQRADIVVERFKSLGKTKQFSAVELSASTQGYSERNLLGEGAFSAVYKGVLHDGEIVAIKKFKNLTCSREALLREVHIMSKIRHRNLVKVLGLVLDSEVHAIVLEFMPNGSLKQYLHQCQKTHTLSLTMVFEIAQGVANALTYLHHEYDVVPIIHGDVKPSNILLDNEFEAHLVDFGLAKLAKSNSDAITLSSNIKGTIGYMAPEFAYTAKITSKADIYSFGVVVLEMVTGISPTHELLHGATLHEWVKDRLLLQDGVNLRKIVQVSLLLSYNSSIESDLESRILPLLHMAVACTESIPARRPTIQFIKAFLDSRCVL